jgi:hypothetical protein
MSKILSNLQQDNKTLQGQFDIRDHLDKLQPGKGKDKYVCPVCEGRNLSIAPKTGKYKCWSGDCLSADIREAIRPLAEFLAERKGERPPRIARKPKAKKKKHPPAPIPFGAKLLRLPAPGKLPRAERPKYFPSVSPTMPHKLPIPTAALKKFCGLNGQIRLSRRDATKLTAKFTLISTARKFGARAMPGGRLTSSMRLLSFSQAFQTANQSSS